MTLFWTIFAIGVVGILMIEWMFWRFFVHRVEGLHLHLSSTTGRRVFTVMRIRFMVMLHTIILLCVVILSLLFLW